MLFLRTPEERFTNLAEWSYAPHYLEILGGRMHYVDEGSGPETILCLHGEPSWSYLYRKMIAPLRQVARVIAPDMLGFGRSDKPAELEDHTYSFHAESLRRFIEALDLRQITLVCQDWGGLLGLPLAVQMPERFARLVIMNTGLPAGDQMTEGFMRWRAFAERVGRSLEAGQLIAISSLSKPSAEVIAAYDAPFPDESYRAGVAALPLRVPISPDMDGAPQMRAARDALRAWHKPALVMFSDGDPVTKGGDRYFRGLIPSAAEQPEIVIAGAGHFLQEEQGALLAEQIAAFLARTPR